MGEFFQFQEDTVLEEVIKEGLQQISKNNAKEIINRANSLIKEKMSGGKDSEEFQTFFLKFDEYSRNLKEAIIKVQQINKSQSGSKAILFQAGKNSFLTLSGRLKSHLTSQKRLEALLKLYKTEQLFLQFLFADLKDKKREGFRTDQFHIYLKGGSDEISLVSLSLEQLQGIEGALSAGKDSIQLLKSKIQDPKRNSNFKETGIDANIWNGTTIFQDKSDKLQGVSSTFQDEIVNKSIEYTQSYNNKHLGKISKMGVYKGMIISKGEPSDDFKIGKPSFPSSMELSTYFNETLKLNKTSSRLYRVYQKREDKIICVPYSPLNLGHKAEAYTRLQGESQGKTIGVKDLKKIIQASIGSLPWYMGGDYKNIQVKSFLKGGSSIHMASYQSILGLANLFLTMSKKWEKEFQKELDSIKKEKEELNKKQPIVKNLIENEKVKIT